jgi:hypothetical protein
MMDLLDHVGIVENNLKRIDCLAADAKCKKDVSKLVAHGLQAVEAINELAGEITDKRTVRAHKFMMMEESRPTMPLKRKQKKRNSSRHVQNLKKRKLDELGKDELVSTLTDLFQAGKLSTPDEVCEVIHGTDTPEHKKQRTFIMKTMHVKFNLPPVKTLRNHYTQYRKFLQKEALPLPIRFGKRRPPIMTVAEFKEEVKRKIASNGHQQKDLRKLTAKVLTKHMSTRHKKAGGSPIMDVKPSGGTVDMYLRIAATCKNAEHVGKVKHSTKTRDTAIRSFRAVCSYVSVVLASQSYPDPDVDADINQIKFKV